MINPLCEMQSALLWSGGILAVLRSDEQPAPAATMLDEVRSASILAAAKGASDPSSCALNASTYGPLSATSFRNRFLAQHAALLAC